MKNNDYVYCKDFRVKCWNWNKKKKEVSEGLKTGVTTSKMSEDELKAYLKELEYKKVGRRK